MGDILFVSAAVGAAACVQEGTSCLRGVGLAAFPFAEPLCDGWGKDRAVEGGESVAYEDGNGEERGAEERLHRVAGRCVIEGLEFSWRVLTRELCVVVISLLYREIAREGKHWHQGGVFIQPDTPGL